MMVQFFILQVVVRMVIGTLTYIDGTVESLLQVVGRCGVH